MADEIVIEPKAPVNPAGKPGLGGLAGIPSLIGSILGADDFCSVWNVPLSGLCVDDPNSDLTGMPAWCSFNPSGYLCPGTTPVLNPDTGVYWDGDYCFNSSLTLMATCGFSKADHMVMHYVGSYTDGFQPEDVVLKPANDLVTCLDKNKKPVNCNLSTQKLGPTNTTSGSWGTVHNGKCYWSAPKDILSGTDIPCTINIAIIPRPETEPMPVAFDKYMRIVDPSTGIPVTNNYYEGGYPITAVYPPPPEPEPVPPFDPGPNPFNPTLPEVPEGQECAGIICECIALVVNALGAVNNTILKVDETLLGMVDQLDDIYGKMPNWFEQLPLELIPIHLKLSDIANKLDEILKAIDGISVNVAKEAETNIWDFLGETIKSLTDLIQFLIDKIIYLVVPESTDNIITSFNTLNTNLSSKFSGAEALKDSMMTAVNVDQKPIENVKKTFVLFGIPVEMTLFNFDYLNMGLPMIRLLMQALMIISTTIWAYRKISSEMIR